MTTTTQEQRHTVIDVLLHNAARKTRVETFLGREFLVVPAVIVRSQVLHNNLGPSFLPAAEITDAWASQWNGIPVLVGPHPTQRGVPVSGRDPAIWNERGVGWIFAARAEQESSEVRRLKTEIWLDLGREDAVEGFATVLDTVRSGGVVELSTGFPALMEETSGEFQGEAFEIVMHPYGADHLVISATMTGACSVAAGCGLGVNSMQEDDAVTYHTVIVNKECGCMTTKTASASTAASENAGAAEKNEATPKGGVLSIFSRAAELFSTRNTERTRRWEESTARRLERELDIINATTPSDQDRASLLGSALQRTYGASDREVIVADVYADAKQVVFWMTTPMGPQPTGREYYRVTFEEQADGTYNFGGLEKVRRMTVYETVAEPAIGGTINAEATNGATGREAASHAISQNAQDGSGGQTSTEDNMDAKEKAEIVNEVTTALTGQLETMLKPLTEQVASVANAAKEAAEAVVTPLSEKVEALAGVVNAERDAERRDLVTRLSTNNRTPFTEAELEAKPLEELRKIAQLAAVPTAVNYTGRGAPRTVAAQNSSEDVAQFAEPVPYFAQNTKAAKAAGEEA